MRSFNFFPILLLIIIILFFFYPVSLFGKLPIPADTIIGLYHPFRDLYAKDYPNGIPFKNSLITDPVRQQYPWRVLTISEERNLSLPLWNPYAMAGSPLLANMQSSAFYPLNLLLFLPDFNIWWSVIILLQPLLAGIFMYLYLRGLKLAALSCFLGGFVYAFSGFSIAWLEWGNIIHVVLWLPLVLLSIDRIFVSFKNPKIQTKNKELILWSSVFIFSLTSSFFAGYLQTFFYLFLVSIFYFLARWFQFGRQKRALITFLILNSCFLILTFIQWFPTLQLINNSAREIDQTWQKEGWFLPVQHLIQFFAPDFFGNPATLNYWGVWNYGEFIGYIGIFPLVIALFALFYRYDKKTLFFGSIFFLSLIFALPSFIAKIPFQLNIPFLNTAQPTRLMFLIDFSLSILAALGFDYFLRMPNKKKLIYPLGFIFLIYLALWIFIISNPFFPPQITAQNISVAKNNLYLPSLIFFLISATVLISLFLKIKKLQTIFIYLLLALTIFDLFRFSYKFLPFTDRKYLFPSTKSLLFLEKRPDIPRIMTTDARILPPNFSIMYNLQSLDGYDPLYLRRYAELIAAMERNAPDIKPPFGFNRIINPHNYDSKIADLMGVKYVLSLSDLSSPKLKKIFEEGQTKVYENKEAYKRAFFVNNIYASAGKEDSIKALFDKNINLKKTAIVEDWNINKTNFLNNNSKVEILKYRNNEVTIKTGNRQEAFLVFTDTFYPTWHAKICNTQNICRETKIYRTDYNFRGIVVPAGENTIIFYNTLL